MHPLTEDQYQQVREARAHPTPTLRATCPAMEDILHEPIPVLDQGFVRVIDYMGDDAAVVQGARVSYGRGTKHVSGDRGLIRYLMRHRHTTPFELCDIKLHVRAPVFVTRQWFRHRTASINEYSARYSVLDREFYTPAADDIAAQSTDNRQGRGEAADPAAAQTVIARLRDDAARAYDSYLWMLNETEDGAPADPARDGIARELARITLPVGIYTQFYWKVNLWNLLHFLDLRASPHAQQEIRVYADAILTVVERWVPHVAVAFNDYVRQGAQLSAQQLAVIRSALSGQAPTDPATSSLSGRELRELLTLLPELAPRLARDAVG